jgi:hypothetical protein
MQMKWIWIASLTLFIVVTVGRSMLVKSPEELVAELRLQYPTKDSCLSGAAQRVAPCTSPRCYEGAWLFFDRCLESADGDKGSFCANVLDNGQDSVGRDVLSTHCQPFTQYETECEKVVQRTAYYCSRII